MNNTQVIQFDRLVQVKSKVFSAIDVAEGTRREYLTRIDNFLRLLEKTVKLTP